MAMKKYSFHYGHGHKDFVIDSDRVIKEVKMAAMEPLQDIKASVLDAIYHPIGTKPINEIIKPGQAPGKAMRHEIQQGQDGAKRVVVKCQHGHADAAGHALQQIEHGAELLA